MNLTPSSRPAATALVLGAFCLSGCGLIDRLTGSGSDTFAIQQFSLDQKTVASGTPVELRRGTHSPAPRSAPSMRARAAGSCSGSA